jgi:hypothetical protein
MTVTEELTALRTAYVLARDSADRAESPIDAMRWEHQMHAYEHDIAELVADADLDVLVRA